VLKLACKIKEVVIKNIVGLAFGVGGFGGGGGEI